MILNPGPRSRGGSAAVRTDSRQELLADFAELVFSISREVSRYTEADEKQSHLTATEINVMRFVDRHAGSMPKDAAAGVGLQRSNFSVALRSLKDKGLIVMTPAEDDGRCMRLFATKLAGRYLARRRRQWARVLASTLNEGVDVRDCVKTLAQIDIALREMREELAEL